MKQLLLTAAICIMNWGNSIAQLIELHPVGDTTRTITLGGYADVYFGYDFNDPKDGNRPYFVSHHRHKEVNVNLSYISLKYTAPNVRATFTPGFGTYMNANYAAERVTLRNIVEANVGFRIFRRKNIWIDAGVISSPYTTENAVSFDQLLYTRSFGAEYSPYYLTGAKLLLPLTKRMSLHLYVVNGWQVIENTNTQLSYGSHLNYRITRKLTVNWSTYFGNEQSTSAPDQRGRLFSDLNATWYASDKFTLSLDMYGGKQKLADSATKAEPTFSFNWGQANLNARYLLSARTSISARAEYFRDTHGIFIIPVTKVSGFDCSSYSLCFNRSVTNEVLFRIEARYFLSGKDVFYNPQQVPVNTDALVTAGITAKF